jgi:hypothetical protein
MPQLRAIVPERFTRSAKNSTGSTIVAKRVVVGYDAAITLPAADTDATFGVTMGDIATGTIGDIQIAGRAIVTSGGAVTAGVLVTQDTAGKVVTWTASGGRAIVGKAVTGTTGGDQDLEVELAHMPSYGAT